MTRSFSDLALHAISHIDPFSDRIAISRLTSAETVPNSVRGFLEMEMEIRVRKDLDSVNDEMAVERTLRHGLQTGSLDRISAAQVLETAYKYAAGYLIEPQRFLLQLLSHGEDIVPLDRYFFHALNFVREYSYFPELLPIWAVGLNTTEVTRLALQSKLREIDRSVTGVLSADHLGLLLSPLFDLFQGTQIEKEIFVRFFTDKGAVGAFAALREDLRYHYSSQEIVELLRQAIAEQSQTSNSPASGSGENYSNFLDELKQAGIVIGAPGAEAWLLEIEQREPRNAIR